MTFGENDIVDVFIPDNIVNIEKSTFWHDPENKIPDPFASVSVAKDLGVSTSFHNTVKIIKRDSMTRKPDYPPKADFLRRLDEVLNCGILSNPAPEISLPADKGEKLIMNLSKEQVLAVYNHLGTG
jgi:hypothetical protein